MKNGEMRIGILILSFIKEMKLVLIFMTRKFADFRIWTLKSWGFQGLI